MVDTMAGKGMEMKVVRGLINICYSRMRCDEPEVSTIRSRIFSPLPLKLSSTNLVRHPWLTGQQATDTK